MRELDDTQQLVNEERIQQLNSLAEELVNETNFRLQPVNI